MEANQGCSKKDFKNRIKISQKEAHELILIFAKISKSCENK